MREFFMWFIRPIAEFLGALALLGALLLIGIAIVAILDFKNRKK